MLIKFYIKRVIPELFDDTSWIKYNWIKEIDFTATRTYYVSCFSKAVNSSNMQEGYGECLYRYKNDKIVDLIDPIGIYKLKKKDDADNDLPIDDYEMSNCYGVKIGRHILINVKNCKTKKKVTETIIHERTHYKYPNEHNQHVECVCDAMAMKHRKGTLAARDLRDIIKSVKERYADRTWR